MEITYAEFCELLELSSEQVTEFADWQSRYALAAGVNINECEFKLGGWYIFWDIFSQPKKKTDFEELILENRAARTPKPA